MKTVSGKHTELFLLLAVTVLGLAALACANSSKVNKDLKGVGPTRAVAIGPTQTPGLDSGGCLQGIFPGKTTREELIAQLGEPTSTETNGDQEMMLYATPKNGEYHTIVLQNNLVVLVSVILDEETPLLWSSVTAQYGRPALTTFSYFQQGSQTYIFPDRGQTFVALPDLDIVYARECFVPMS